MPAQETLEHSEAGFDLYGPPAAGIVEMGQEAPEEGQPELARSFPRPGSVLAFPPRESRFTFSRAVEASGFSAVLVTLPGGSGEPLQRLSSGSVEDVLIRIPVLGAGDYRLDWSLVTSEGRVEGSVDFSIAEPLVAPGGGNHRHSTDDLFLESFASWAPRSALLLFAGVLLGLWRGSRSREESFADVLTLRASGALLAATSLFGVGAAVVEGLVRWGDHPLFAVLASDSVWVYLAATALGVVLGLSGRPGTPLLWSALLLGALVWSVGPFMQFRYGTAVPVLSFVLYSLAVLFSSEMLMALRGWVSAWRPAALVVASVSVSALLLVATAQTFSLIGAFAQRWSVQGPLSALAVVLSLVWLRVPPSAVRSRVLLAASLAVLVALGLWTPPPAPGL